MKRGFYLILSTSVVAFAAGLIGFVYYGVAWVRLDILANKTFPPDKVFWDGMVNDMLISLGFFMLGCVGWIGLCLANDIKRGRISDG